jgi:hypothetical protein
MGHAQIGHQIGYTYPHQPFSPKAPRRQAQDAQAGFFFVINMIAHGCGIKPLFI